MTTDELSIGAKMDIKRVLSSATGRSDAVAFNGMAFLVAYDPDAAEGIDAQTRNCLRFLDAKLAEVGSEKQALLQVTVFLSDMKLKPAMDSVWCDWIGPPDNWPQKACVGVDLSDGTLIEITAIAALMER